MDDPHGSSASSEQGANAEQPRPEDGSYPNTRLHVADLGKILRMSGHMERPPTLESIVLPKFMEGRDLVVPSNSFDEALDEFGEAGTLILIATFRNIERDLDSIDAVMALGRARLVPIVVFSYASKEAWEDAFQQHERNRGVRFMAPQVSLAEQLRVSLWPEHGWNTPGSVRELRNALFLLERDPVRKKYKFSGSWMSTDPDARHDVLAIDQFLTTVRNIRQLKALP